MSQQTSDLQKEQFKKYLKKSGVMDQISLIITRLYELKQRPHNAVEFIKQNLGVSDNLEIEKYQIYKESLEEDLNEFNKSLTQEQNELQQLKEHLASLQ